MFCRSLFVLFLLTIVLSVLLRYTDSDYPFGIFKLFLLKIEDRDIFHLIIQEISISFTRVKRRNFTLMENVKWIKNNEKSQKSSNIYIYICLKIKPNSVRIRF